MEAIVIPVGTKYGSFSRIVNWCYQKEQIDQEALHNVLRTGLSKERGRGWGSLTGQSGRRN
jgi:hypothetical protein